MVQSLFIYWRHSVAVVAVMKPAKGIKKIKDWSKHKKYNIIILYYIFFVLKCLLQICVWGWYHYTYIIILQLSFGVFIKERKGFKVIWNSINYKLLITMYNHPDNICSFLLTVFNQYLSLTLWYFGTVTPMTPLYAGVYWPMTLGVLHYKCDKAIYKPKVKTKGFFPG